MKKAVVLFSSPNSNGSTRRLTDIFMSSFDGELIEYDMFEERISPCIGCESCKSSGECFMKDTDKILHNIFSSDYIIFSSPIYNYSFPSPMKSFLDRLQPYFYTEKGKAHRKGFLLVTCGCSGKFSVDVVEKQCKMAFSEINCEYKDKYVQTNTDKEKYLSAEEMCKVNKLANDFFS